MKKEEQIAMLNKEGKITEDTKETKKIYLVHYKELKQLLETPKEETRIELDVDEKVERVNRSCKREAFHFISYLTYQSMIHTITLLTVQEVQNKIIALIQTTNST